VTVDPPFISAIALAFASILVVEFLEVLPDRRLAILAVVMMVVACGIVCCTVVTG
jgi:predicted PurR-regulated permease PerM